MPTVKSLADLLASMPPGGGYTAEELQDFLVSVFPPQFSGARISDPAGADQAVGSTFSNVFVTFDTVDYDTDGYADLGTSPTRLTAPFGGLYEIGACVGVNAAANHMLDGRIEQNGTSLLVIDRTFMGLAQSRILTLSTRVNASANDFFQLIVQSSNVTGIFHASFAPNFWISYLGQVPA